MASRRWPQHREASCFQHMAFTASSTLPYRMAAKIAIVIGLAIGDFIHYDDFSKLMEQYDALISGIPTDFSEIYIFPSCLHLLDDSTRGSRRAAGFQGLIGDGLGERPRCAVACRMIISRLYAFKFAAIGQWRYITSSKTATSMRAIARKWPELKPPASDLRIYIYSRASK